MGGNGAGSHFRNGTLDSYPGVRFQQVGDIDGVKVIKASTQKNTAVPMEAFTSKMYYIVSPKDPNRILHIAFYDKQGKIKLTINLKYDSDGNIIPFCQHKRKGAVHTPGTHVHAWSISLNGDSGRIPHATKNIFKVPRYYMRYVNKVLNFNRKHGNKA